MQSFSPRSQEDLFVSMPLSGLVPDEHILKRVDKVIDLSWLHEAVRGCYCQDNGRPSIDPESALRLMLAGFFQGIVHDRALMREAQVNLAIRWFAGYRLDEPLPDRSSLTRIRQRWGEALFRSIFERTVSQCAKAGLVSTDTVHVDATLIRADVSWDSLTTRHVEQVLEANTDKDDTDSDEPPPPRRGRPRKTALKRKKYSPTDPDASMATSCKQYHLEPSYKQHTAVEDSHGVIVDVAVTTGETNEGKQLLEQIERIEASVGTAIDSVTCDAAYAHGTNYEALEQRQIDAVIPPPPIVLRKTLPQRLPARRFKYDPHHKRITCPNGKTLSPRSRSTNGSGTIYRSRTQDCRSCPLRERCLPPSSPVRQIVIGDGYPALLRARRRKEKGWNETAREKYIRHRWHVEGVHGRAKTQHALRRAARRGLPNVAIQAYMTAATMNLKKLADCQRLLPQLRALWTAITAPRQPAAPIVA